MTAGSQPQAKWRPPLALVLIAVLLIVLALPLVSLFFFRLYENQLIQRTEAELIGQAVAIAAIVSREMAGRPPSALGPPVSTGGQDPSEPFHPIEPSLDLATGPILVRRPDGRAPVRPPGPADLSLGEQLAPVLLALQARTLAGFRLLDHNGTVITPRGGEAGLSLAHVEEIRDALEGRFRSVLRHRATRDPPPPLYSISRGTDVRVFVALPVAVDGRVGAVVYAARTPTNIVRQLYNEREKATLAVATVLLATLVIGVLFSRFVTGPVHELVRRTAAIGAGDRTAMVPLSRHGVREVAQLSKSFLDMAEQVHARSDFLRAFAAHVSHELKSPLTAIRGASELMLDAGPDGMAEADRRRFLGNILADTERLTHLVGRLRELAQAETDPAAGSARLEVAVAALRSRFAGLALHVEGRPDLVLPISDDSLAIALSHLADNAVRHGADTLHLLAGEEFAGPTVTVRDNGGGISPANRARIFEEFFTTRRATGGTGMGLPIVRALLARHGASVELLDGAGPGATFRIAFGAGASRPARDRAGRRRASDRVEARS